MSPMLQPARFYTGENDKIRCLLCPRRCLIGEGHTGFCGVRRVEKGELYTENYGFCAALHWDPIEKKPLYHFYPGRQILSVGTYGCNLRCSFCQNWSLVLGRPEADDRRLSPEELLALLQRAGGPDEVVGMAYTYNEPTIWYEYVAETARLLHEHGYRNVLVTNGYISPEPLVELLPYIDAMNIDVKAFNDSFYEQHCRGRRGPVLETVALAAASVHVEVTALLIPTLNDRPEELARLSSWLAGIDPEIPLHFSRYFPRHRMSLPPTPPETMLAAREIALEKLHYVYLGNIEIAGSADTRCPRCGNLLIARSLYQIRMPGLRDNRCLQCDAPINLLPAPPGRRA